MDYKVEQGKEIISSNIGTAIVGKYLENQNVCQYINNNMQGNSAEKTRGYNVISSWIGLLIKRSSFPISFGQYCKKRSTGKRSLFHSHRLYDASNVWLL